MKSGGPAPGLATVAAMGWKLLYDGNRATYSGGYCTGLPARIAPSGVNATLAPTGGDTTKPIAPLLRMGELTGPFFRTSLAALTPTWGKGGYLEAPVTVDGSSLTEMTRIVVGYANLDLPTGYSERQELFGCNVSGGGAEPTNLLGYPGTLQTKISEYNGGAVAWKPSTTAPESRLFCVVSVFKSSGDVWLYFNGQLVDVITAGWTPGVQLVNVFMGAAWHAGTTSMSAPYDGHLFLAGYATRAFSPAEVSKTIANVFIAAGRDVTADWWPNDDASVVEFLDLGGRQLQEYSGDSGATQRVRAWQGRDSNTRVHSTASEAASPARGMLAADLLNFRETTVFDGVDDKLTAGDLAHLLDASKRFIGHFALLIGTGAVTVDTSVHRAGWLGHVIAGDTGGTYNLSLVKDTANEYGFGVNAIVLRWMIYSTTERTIAVRVYENTPMIIEHGVDASDNLQLRVCDANGKRSATPTARGTYAPSAANIILFGTAYLGSSYLAGKLSRWTHRAGWDTTYQGNARAWALREYAIDCS